jgi:glutathione S-transferase
LVKRLRFFHRPACHLCEDMLEHLEILRQTTPFELEQVDVDGDDGLRAGYQLRVPVLEDPEGNLLSEVYLNPQAVLSYLRDA